MVKDSLVKFKKTIAKNEILFAVVCAVVLIVVGASLGWYNNRVVPLNPSVTARYVAEPHNRLSFMANWDGVNYISIATHGYQHVNQTNFFPLYPLLIHYLNKLIDSPLDSALIVAWLGLIGAIYYYTKIIKHLYKLKDNINVLKALMFFILFPSAVFLIAAYTESLFAFFALGAIYYALKKNPIKTAAFSLLCCITHLDGVFVLALVCLILLGQKVDLWKVIVTGIVSLLGIIYYSVYLLNKFNSPLAFIYSQKAHGWLTHEYNEIYTSINFLNAVFLILLIVSVIYWWKRRRSFAFYSFLFLLIPLIGNQFGGFNRYVLMAFPLQLMAYDYFKKRPFAYALIIGLMGIIWAYTVMQYMGGYTGS